MLTSRAVFSRSVVFGAIVSTPALAQDKEQLQKCDRPFGTIALAAPREEHTQYFRRYSPGSPAALLRAMVQQSKCFVVVGAYTNTAERKLIASSYFDNYNNVVTALKADAPMMARAQKFDASKLTSGDAARAGTVFAEGDLLCPKIDNVKLLAAPQDSATVNAVLKKSDDLVFLGVEKDGFLKVQGAMAEGWVKKTLVSKL